MPLRNIPYMYCNSFLLFTLCGPAKYTIPIVSLRIRCVISLRMYNMLLGISCNCCRLAGRNITVLLLP